MSRSVKSVKIALSGRPKADLDANGVFRPHSSVKELQLRSIKGALQGPVDLKEL